MRTLQLLAFMLLTAACMQAQAEWPKPNWEKVARTSCRRADKPMSSTVGAFDVQLVPARLHEPGDSLCRAYLVDRAGSQTLLLEDWDVSIYEGTGEDVFGNGSPSLILEGYSGGAHCCYTYKIVSLGEILVSLPGIENGAPFFFFKDAASGQYRIMTSDGAFDSFDGMCHACAPLPRVVLKVEAGGLRDVSSQFIEQYDSEIALARAKIAPGDIQKFLVADFGDAKKVVLEIVLAYLYSGRKGQAWQTLDEMWPAADRERIRKLILKARANGILSKLAKSAIAARSNTH